MTISFNKSAKTKPYESDNQRVQIVDTSGYIHIHNRIYFYDPNMNQYNHLLLTCIHLLRTVRVESTKAWSLIVYCVHQLGYLEGQEHHWCLTKSEDLLQQVAGYVVAQVNEIWNLNEQCMVQWRLACTWNEYGLQSKF